MAATPRLSWNLRVTPGDQELIDRAVSASGLTRTDFVLQAARAAAQELLVEQTWSAMEPEAFEAFCRQLDAWLTDTTARPLATERVSADWVGREP